MIQTLTLNDHKGLANIGTNTHAQIDSHLGSASNPHSVTLAQVGGTTDHTALSNIGTNSHLAIDTFIGTTVPTTYLPLAGGTMVGNIIFNDSISALFGTGSDLEIFHNGTDSYIQNNTGGIIIENDASDGDISFKVNDGGVDTTVMTLDGATGNVGIGTTGPTEKLNVAGVGRFTSRIQVVGHTPLPGTRGGVEFGHDSSNNRGFVESFESTSATYADFLFTAKTIQLWTGTSPSEKARIDNNGNVGIGTTGPTAYLHIKAGTASANTAPIKLTSGTLNTTPVAGCIEFDGTNLYFVDSGGTRRQLAVV